MNSENSQVASSCKREVKEYDQVRDVWLRYSGATETGWGVRMRFRSAVKI